MEIVLETVQCKWKMFNIADHILNAEPVYPGSQVYKTTRADGAFSAVHIFPFEITIEQHEYFRQQMVLLAEVVTEYRAAIPEPLGWGFTKTRSFPYIETEWIEGMSLDEKTGVNNGSTFPIKEVMIIAEQVSRILTLCHNLGLQHGAVKLQNILWDSGKDRYVLTGFNFGLDVYKKGGEHLPPRESFVPARKEATALQRRDIYDLGVVLFQLLKDHSSIDEWNGTSLNEEQEKNIPSWLVNAVSRCLSNDANEQFRNIAELYNYVLLHHKTPLQRKAWYRSKPQQDILPKPPLQKPARTVKSLKVKPLQKTVRQKKMRFVFDPYIAGGLVIAILLTGFSIEAQKKEKEVKKQLAAAPVKKDTTKQTGSDLSYRNQPATIQKQKEPPPVKQEIQTKKPVQKAAEKPVTVSLVEKDSNIDKTTGLPAAELGAYKVRSRAYFHNQPDESTRRNAFIVHWNNAVLHPREEQNDFVYIVFTNHEGQTTRGWLRKKDLIRVGK